MLFGEPLVSTQSRLLVKHEVISDSEAKKILKKFKITVDKFPKILETDPQVVKIGAKAGQLIIIHRNDPNGSYPYYRYVVK